MASPYLATGSRSFISNAMCAAANARWWSLWSEISLLLAYCCFVVGFRSLHSEQKVDRRNPQKSSGQHKRERRTNRKGIAHFADIRNDTHGLINRRVHQQGQQQTSI